MKRYVLWAIGWVWVSVMAGCSGGSTGGMKDACTDGEPVDVAHYDVGPTDAEADGPTCIPTPPIDATPGVITRLPPTGENDMSSVGNYDRYVVYSEVRNNNGNPYNFEIFLYDLELGQETQITDDNIEVQWDPYVWGTEVMWSNGFAEDATAVSAVMAYEIDTGEAIELIAPDHNNRVPRFNGDSILYASDEGVAGEEFNWSLYLMDRQSGEKRMVSPYYYYAETGSLGDKYAVWVAYNPEGSSVGKDVYYYDPRTDEVTRIESTASGHQYCPTNTGDLIFWEDDRNGNWDIYMYDTRTGQEERLTYDPNDQRLARARGHLLTWMDFRWSCARYGGRFNPRDMVIYDIETGVMRRVTSSSEPWGNCYAQGRWFVYVKSVGYRKWHIFAHDLVADGILDGPDGHVIPADPVDP